VTRSTRRPAPAAAAVPAGGTVAPGRAPASASRPAWGLPHRFLRLCTGLLVFGVALALLLRSGLGAAPWDVLHEGVVLRSGLAFGLVVVLSGVVVLLLWLPLRVRPGVGTVLNVLLVAAGIELGLLLLPEAEGLPLAVVMLVTGVALNAAGTALYIGARLGTGPRDGLMTGLTALTGLPVGLVKAAIEVSVVLAGWLLGGTVGVGTVVFALGVGPLVGLLLPRLDMPGGAARAAAAAAARATAPPPTGTAPWSRRRVDRLSGPPAGTGG